MPDKWTDRILGEVADLRAQVAGLQRGQQEQRRQDDATRRAVDPSLQRGSLVTPFRIASHDRPGLTGGLQERLKEDGLMPYHDAGSSAIYSANVLRDPLMTSILDPGPITVGTSWTSVGGAWEARKRGISGAGPTVIAKRTHKRKLMEGNIYRSDVLVLDIEYPGVGAAWVELRPKVATEAPVHIDWPWCVVCCRVYIDKQIRPWTNLVQNDPDDYADGDESNVDDDPPNYVRMAMVNGAWPDDDDPDETGDEVDLEELSDDKMESQVYVGTEDVNKTHWWLLQIRTESEGAGGIAVAVAEPQVNYTYQEAPMPFDPDIGNYDPCGECEPFDGSSCTLEPATGGSLTLVSIGAYHQGHYDEPPGAKVNFTGPGGSDYFTDGMGSVAGTHNYPWTGIPPWSSCAGVGTGLVAGARHTGTWARYTIAAKPGNTRAGLRVTLTTGLPSFPSPAKYMGLMVKRNAAPTGVHDGAMVDSWSPISETRQVMIPASLIPPVGEDIYIGVVPVTLAVEGGQYCNEGNWPATLGSGGSWKALATMDAIAWFASSCVIGSGQEFNRLEVGMGDGSNASFEGWPTRDGSAEWFVDGLLTEPLTYDDTTGMAVFDRPPHVGAKVEQSGTGR